MKEINNEKIITGKIVKTDFADDLLNKEFNDCEFTKCNFEKINIEKCKFNNCVFIECNLSLINLRGRSLIDVAFDDSKIIGVNWTQAKWPLYKLDSPLSFYRCNISDSSFFSLSLAQIIIESCKAHDVDFRSADLSSANLAYTDFYNSLFMHTNLTAADFTEAINYSININENTIKKAKFSFPEVVALLKNLDIKIIGLDE